MSWECYQDQDAVCEHLGSETVKNNCIKKHVKKVYFRNRMIYNAIHLESRLSHINKAKILFLDVIPKLLLGKTWILSSYKEFLEMHFKIYRSRLRFKKLMEIQSHQAPNQKAAKLTIHHLDEVKLNFTN
ncbi:hypothetical protein MM236_19565 [Belliella sp. DSM 107340]|uniref:Uncharacterized protein n=1 Tax=Belliella calami TaxID=2923436 RepID=A0ABS9UU97_9BACT|nr:hypothetical protein [Belliella calami]MCH7400201.1 hypothetical protein [Belliella calami]